jgi:hypothetical protein
MAPGRSGGLPSRVMRVVNGKQIVGLSRDEADVLMNP